jgi:Zn-dependent M28 family amino/carboxypeptidase
MKNIVCDLNIDMIGRIDPAHEQKNVKDYIYLIGSDKISQELHELSEAVNKKCCGLELDYTYNNENDPNRFYYRSDHYNFARFGIPVIFYFNGTHADYHKSTDDWDKIDFEKASKITKLIFRTTNEIANLSHRLKLNSER